MVKIEKLILKTKAIDNLLLAPMERVPTQFVSQAWIRSQARVHTQFLSQSQACGPSRIVPHRELNSY